MDHCIVTGRHWCVVHWFSEGSGRGDNFRRLGPEFRLVNESLWKKSLLIFGWMNPFQFFSVCLLVQKLIYAGIYAN